MQPTGPIPNWLNVPAQNELDGANMPSGHRFRNLAIAAVDLSKFGSTAEQIVASSLLLGAAQSRFLVERFERQVISEASSTAATLRLNLSSGEVAEFDAAPIAKVYDRGAAQIVKAPVECLQWDRSQQFGWGTVLTEAAARFEKETSVSLGFLTKSAVTSSDFPQLRGSHDNIPMVKLAAYTALGTLCEQNAVGYLLNQTEPTEHSRGESALRLIFPANDAARQLVSPFSVLAQSPSAAAEFLQRNLLGLIEKLGDAMPDAALRDHAVSVLLKSLGFVPDVFGTSLWAVSAADNSIGLTLSQAGRNKLTLTVQSTSRRARQPQAIGRN